MDRYTEFGQESSSVGHLIELLHEAYDWKTVRLC